MKEYRKVTGKISWLANYTRPDMIYTSLSMSKKTKNATIADLRNVTKVVKKAKERLSQLIYSKIANKNNLIIIRIGDTSFKVDDKTVGGVILLLANMAMTHAVPIYWKSKYIARVCYSSKDTETINLVRLMEDAVYTLRPRRSHHEKYS